MLLQEMDSQCARMVHELALAQARSDRPSADPFLQPILQGQGHSLQARASAAKPQTALPAATMPAQGSSGEVTGTVAGALHRGPSGATSNKGSAAEPKGSLASLIAPAASKLPAALRQQPAPGRYSACSLSICDAALQVRVTRQTARKTYFF